MNEEFDGIVAQEDVSDEVAPPEFSTMNEVVAHYWPLFNPGSVYVGGVIIVEAVYPQYRNLRHMSDIPQWTVLGMIESTKMQIQAENVDEVLNAGYEISPASDEDDEGDVESDE